MTRKNGAKPVRTPPLTIPEAAEALGVSRMQVYRLIHLGHLEYLELPSTITGGRRSFRIEQAALDRFLAACRRPATT